MPRFWPAQTRVERLALSCRRACRIGAPDGCCVQQLNARPVAEHALAWFKPITTLSAVRREVKHIRLSKSSRPSFLPLLSLAQRRQSQPSNPASRHRVKFGNIMPYSGPASALSVTGKAFAAISTDQREGRVNGRKLNMVCSTTVFRRQRRSRRRADGRERRRRLHVRTMGTAPSFGDREISQRRQVPHLFLISSARNGTTRSTSPG